MELLIIKDGDEYIRIKDGKYLRVGLDKASVYPTDMLDTVREHAEQLEKDGCKQVHLKKLILTEEELEQ